MDDTNQSLSKTVGELLLMDVFARYNLSKDTRRSLTDEQREEIRKIVDDLKTKTEQFLQNAQTRTISNGASEDTVSNTRSDLDLLSSTQQQIEGSQSTSKLFIVDEKHNKPKRKRLTLKKPGRS